MIRSVNRLLQGMRTFGALLGSVMGIGCVGVKLEAVLGFARDGEHVVRQGESRALELVNVRSKAVLWSRPLPDSDRLVGKSADFSPNGRFFVLAEEDRLRHPKGRHSIWRSDSGERVSPFIDWKDESSPGPARVSDDGRWLASAVARDDLRVYEAASGRIVHTERGIAAAAHSPGWPFVMAFAPGAPMFTVSRAVFRLTDAGWRRVALFAEALDHVWVGRRLAMLTERGLVVWEAATEGTASPEATKVYPYHFDFKYKPEKSPTENAALASDGDLLAVYEITRFSDDCLLEVYDLARGTSVLQKRGLGEIMQVVIDGQTAWVMVVRGTFRVSVLAIDIGSGRVLQEIDLGDYGRGGVRSSPEVLVFHPSLLPGGKYVDLFDGVRWHKFHRLADPAEKR